MDSRTLQSIKQRYGIVGNHEGLNHALTIALKIAPVDLSVLIMGENGVGKEIFPRIIHDHSARKGHQYLAVNCGAIPEGTIDSELFGHEKGAFTGAIDRREGYFAVADGGTLFLDEVGELPLSTQARLLRVLETGEFIPVGASEVHHTNVRIIAATNVNMEQAIRDGKFRQDLYYRLCSVALSLPALRERGNDILLLFRKFALEMSEKYHMPPIRLDQAAAQMLTAYAWPGNVRQLKNLAENMSVTSEAREITAPILAQYLPATSTARSIVTVGEKTPHRYDQERELIYQMLFELRRDVNELKRIVGLTNRGEHDAWPTKSLPAQPDSRSDSHATPSIYGTHATPHAPHHFGETDTAAIQEVEEVKDSDYTTPSPHPDIISMPAHTTAPEAHKDSTDLSNIDHKLETLERQSIKSVLALNNGNRRLTAQQLGISERTLYRKIKEYELE